jgi:hypothetical protein
MTGWKDMPSNDRRSSGNPEYSGRGRQKQKSRSFSVTHGRCAMPAFPAIPATVDMYDAFDINFGIQCQRLCLRL